jgi:hypothetical protein
MLLAVACACALLLATAQAGPELPPWSQPGRRPPGIMKEYFGAHPIAKLHLSSDARAPVFAILQTSNSRMATSSIVACTCVLLWRQSRMVQKQSHRGTAYFMARQCRPEHTCVPCRA